MTYLEILKAAREIVAHDKDGIFIGRQHYICVAITYVSINANEYEKNRFLRNWIIGMLDGEMIFKQWLNCKLNDYDLPDFC